MVFNIGKTHDVRNRFTFGVLALVLLALVNTLDAQGMNFLRHRLIYLSLDPDKGFIFITQLFFQFSQRHFQQFGKFGQLRRASFDILWNGPNAGSGHAGRQNQSVAIQDATPVGGQLQCSGKPHFTLTLEKGIGINLNVGSPDTQSDKSSCNQTHDEFAAPDRRLAGQQGAGGVENALIHAAPFARRPPACTPHTA